MREVVAVVPGQPSTEALDAVEAGTDDWIRSEGIQEARTSRVRAFGVDAVRVDGTLVEADAPRMHVTSVTFYRNRRRFELQCICSESDEQPEMPGGAGFRELIIRDQPRNTAIG